MTEIFIDVNLYGLPYNHKSGLAGRLIKTHETATDTIAGMVNLSGRVDRQLFSDESLDENLLHGNVSLSGAYIRQREHAVEEDALRGAVALNGRTFQQLQQVVEENVLQGNVALAGVYEPNVRTMFEASSATQISGSVAAYLGGTVFAVLTSRAPVTTPSGWTLVEGNSVVTSSGYTQYLHVFSKTATSDNESFSISGLSRSDRLYLTMLSFKDHYTTSTMYSQGFTNFTQTITVNTLQSGKVLWAVSANLWGTTTPYDLWTTTPAVTESVLFPNTTQGRQGVFISEEVVGTRSFIAGTTDDNSAVVLGILLS